MSVSRFRVFQSRFSRVCVLLVALLIGWISFWGTPAAFAGLNDDNFDGNIYALYGGNGSLVPPRTTLADSLARSDRATLLVFYVDDSRESKQFSTVVSQLQAYYGRVTDFIPYSADMIAPKSKYQPTEPGYYFKGIVPQTVVFDQAGKVRLNAKGTISFEKIDDVFREVFDLLPRSESAELRRRQVNEISVELAK